MGQWLLITRILHKYNKSLSSLIAEYLTNFIEVHIHVLYEDKDIADMYTTNPGILLGELGEKLVKQGGNEVMRNYTGKPAKLALKKRIVKNFDENIPKIIDDEGQFK
jgi:hypothetical protein